MNLLNEQKIENLALSALSVWKNINQYDSKQVFFKDLGNEMDRLEKYIVNANHNGNDEGLVFVWKEGDRVSIKIASNPEDLTAILLALIEHYKQIIGHDVRAICEEVEVEKIWARNRYN